MFFRVVGVPGLNIIEHQEEEPRLSTSKAPDTSTSTPSWPWTDIKDPSVRTALALGLHPSRLPVFTGELTTNSTAAVSALKFALAHPLLPNFSSECDEDLSKHHMKMTLSAAAKKRGRKLEPISGAAIKLPPTPTTEKVQSIEGILFGMKKRLQVSTLMEARA